MLLEKDLALRVSLLTSGSAKLTEGRVAETVPMLINLGSLLLQYAFRNPPLAQCWCFDYGEPMASSPVRTGCSPTQLCQTLRVLPTAPFHKVQRAYPYLYWHYYCLVSAPPTTCTTINAMWTTNFDETGIERRARELHDRADLHCLFRGQTDRLRTELHSSKLRLLVDRSKSTLSRISGEKIYDNRVQSAHRIAWLI